MAKRIWPRFSSRSCTFALSLALLAAAHAACRPGMTPEPEAVLAPVTRVNVPVGEYHSVAWVGHRLIVQFEPDPEHGHIFTNRLAEIEPVSGTPSILDLPRHERCGPDGQNAFVAPEPLPDGRLGYYVHCRPKNDLQNDWMYMMAYDMDTGQVEHLLDFAIPTGFFGTGGYPWNPEMTRALTGEGRDRYIFPVSSL